MPDGGGEGRTDERGRILVRVAGCRTRLLLRGVLPAFARRRQHDRAERAELGRSLRGPAGELVTHPPPKSVAIAHCPGCGRVCFARYLNREDHAPARYCRLCGALLALALYRFEREVLVAPKVSP